MAGTQEIAVFPFKFLERLHKIMVKMQTLSQRNEHATQSHSKLGLLWVKGWDCTITASSLLIFTTLKPPYFTCLWFKNRRMGNETPVSPS